jgi:hypothetical protein
MSGEIARRCIVCQTKLSRYNDSPTYCFTHDRPSFAVANGWAEARDRRLDALLRGGSAAVLSTGR